MAGSRQTGSEGSAAVEAQADVLVLGGGPAGTWAALSAARAGARVVLADKGFCGTSGATAAAGTAIWHVPPEPAARETALASREALGGFLADRAWGARVLDQTIDGVQELAEWGYPFPRDRDGREQRASLQGPEYMRLMRKRVKAAGVTVLDQSPALRLLVDADGTVSGAAGIRRQRGDDWRVTAGAVVVATGGCAFLSRALGCNVLTGDGYLFAAEAGAELSGMEFSNAYGLSAEYASVTKALFFNWATFSYADGTEIPGAGSARGRSVIARTLLEQPVYARLDKADPAIAAAMRRAQPNFFLPHDRQGIDPFRDRFPIALRLEGTVRGTGGLRLIDAQCATTVPGLYAAGDAATREPICGGFTGGGSHNAAWAMSSGRWAGAGAAAFARHRGGVGATSGAGRAGLTEEADAAVDADALVRSVQDEVMPLDRNYFRSQAGLTDSLARLDGLWHRLRRSRGGGHDRVLRTRESLAMLATARWMYRSALARTETRGMHRRDDHAALDERQRHHLTAAGLDEITVTARAA
jgi:succinate dehydrogenase/fumarate reductase flavoprotein subunit